MDHGKKLKIYLYSQKISIDSFAKMVKVTRATIHSWINRSVFNDKIINKVMQAGVPESIFNEVEPKIIDSRVEERISRLEGQVDILLKMIANFKE